MYFTTNFIDIINIIGELVIPICTTITAVIVYKIHKNLKAMLKENGRTK